MSESGCAIQHSARELLTTESRFVDLFLAIHQRLYVVELASGDVWLVDTKNIEASGPASLVLYLIVLLGVCSFTPLSSVVRQYKQRAPHVE